jgi:hypothetical protein
VFEFIFCICGVPVVSCCKFAIAKPSNASAAIATATTQKVTNLVFIKNPPLSCCGAAGQRPELRGKEKI